MRWLKYPPPRSLLVQRSIADDIQHKFCRVNIIGTDGPVTSKIVGQNLIAKVHGFATALEGQQTI